MIENTLIAEPFADTSLLRFRQLSRMASFVHAITVKPWNMAPHRQTDREQVIRRRQQVCQYLGLSFDRLTAPDQIHSNHVLRVSAGDVGAGRLGREASAESEGKAGR